MKIRALVIWAVMGIGVTSAAAMALPVPPPSRAPDDGDARSKTIARTTEGKPVDASGAHFTAGQTLLVDSRLGHASLPQSNLPGATAETYVLSSVTGADASGAIAPPLNLAIVLDRSGSMAKNNRMNNAIAAAVTAVEHMRDVDSVTVVSFDTSARVVVSPTRTLASTRPSIEAAIRTITVMGDTCISCGLDEAMRVLRTSAAAPDSVNRILLLSDGEATHGVKDVPGMRAMAARMRTEGFAITTLGVDVDFDERMMTALASESNGGHYFVRDPSELPAIFAREFQTLESSVARDAELSIELAPGTEVLEVFDRSFRTERVGGASPATRVIVPFGTFAAREEKTVLMRVRVPTDREGREPIARVRLSYRDLVERRAASCQGDLSMAVTVGTSQPQLDSFVAARLERSKTAKTLTDANDLFGKGQADAALSLLAARRAEIAEVEKTATASASAAPAKPKGKDLADDFAQQAGAVDTATKNFKPTPATTPPPPTSTAGKTATKSNAEIAMPMSL